MHASDTLSDEFEHYELIALVPVGFLNRTAEIFDKFSVRQFRIRAIPYLKIRGWSVFYNTFSALIVMIGNKEIVITRSVLFASWAMKFGKQVYLEMHQEEWKRNSRVKNRLQKLLSSAKLLGIGTNTLALKRSFLNDFDYKADDVINLPNGTVLHDPEQTSDSPARVLDQYQDHFLAGYSGSLQEGKGGDLVIEIANQETDPKVMFVILGGRASQIASLKKKVTGNNVVFLGRCEHKHVASFLERFDVCLLPNKDKMKTGKKSMDTGHVTSPIKLFEYMGAGKPILATKVEVLGEILTDAFSIQIPSNDLKQWSEAIIKLKENPERCREMGQMAREQVAQHYTWKKRAEKLTQFLMDRYNT